MDKKYSRIFFVLFPIAFLILSILYIYSRVEPLLYFHQAQSPFLFSADFRNPFYLYPGGISELIGNLFMQFFYFKYFGIAFLFGFSLLVAGLVKVLLDEIYKSRFNIILSLLPFALTFILINNYRFPFSISISLIFVLLLLLILAKSNKKITDFIIVYSTGALVIYYFSGSGYLMLYSLASLFFMSKLKLWPKAIVVGIVVSLSFLIPFLSSKFIFPLATDTTYSYFFPKEHYFMEYQPTIVFYIYLIILPLFLLLGSAIVLFQKNKKLEIFWDRILIPKMTLVFVSVLGLTYYCHITEFNDDLKKITEADYCSYTNNIGGTIRAATTLKEYNFSANLNHNLVVSKNGLFTERFFDFFQINGIDALHPDNQFSADMSFIATDFYYNLGFISEARHWAYESLVFYPHSIRAMQSLVKIHLVLKEYKAAERCLNVLERGILDKDFIKEFRPLVEDTMLVTLNKEIIEKRSFIPAEKELSTTSKKRFIELYEANKKNKTAYEHLMMYYLLDSDLKSFVELYKSVGKYFEQPVAIFEEAILIYGALNKLDVKLEYKISTASVTKFESFYREMKKYGGENRLAISELYPEFGDSYLYFSQLIYPRIVKPENLDEDVGLPAI